jgi:CDP-2,3-bis-(O-geranylgeranyl)-sn-glycerol synthase
MQIEPIIDVLILLAAANGAPVFAKKLMGDFLARPLDGGRAFVDGRPVFGPSKTARGIVASVAVTGLAAPALGHRWEIGIAVALLAMAGDLISSFAKRRLDVPPSNMALGLDQIPESLLPALACMPLMGLGYGEVAAVTAIFLAGELVLSRILYWLKIRDRPY